MDLCTAINERRLIGFFYKGHQRVLKPAAHGPHKTTRTPVLRAYQVGGERNTGETPGWGMYDLNDVQGLTVLEETFEDNPPGYRRGDKHILPIHCEL
jgi:hypothetical protein